MTASTGFDGVTDRATHTRLEADDERDKETRSSAAALEKGHEIWMGIGATGMRRARPRRSSAGEAREDVGKGCSLHATREERQRVWMRRFLAKWRTPTISRHHGGSCAK